MICIAVALDAVFTGRTYGTGPAYGPISAQLWPSRTTKALVGDYQSAQTQNVAQLGLGERGDRLEPD